MASGASMHQASLCVGEVGSHGFVQQVMPSHQQKGGRKEEHSFCKSYPLKGIYIYVMLVPWIILVVWS